MERSETESASEESFRKHKTLYCDDLQSFQLGFEAGAEWMEKRMNEEISRNNGQLKEILEMVWKW